MLYALCSMQSMKYFIFPFLMQLSQFHAIVLLLIFNEKRARKNGPVGFSIKHIPYTVYRILLPLFIHVSQVVVQIDVSRFNYVSRSLCLCIWGTRAREISLIGIIIVSSNWYRWPNLVRYFNFDYLIAISKVWENGWEQDNRKTNRSRYPIHRSWF